MVQVQTYRCFLYIAIPTMTANKTHPAPIDPLTMGGGMRIYGGYVYGLHDGKECRNEQQRAINI